MARKLNRSQSAISRELKRGNIFDFSNLSKRQLFNLAICPTYVTFDNIYYVN
ncbi:helix-turn-helix domain-containing protein [Leuconostoc gasicomitatum]|uniref:helix-turn-helix domain-containing protein n=1 Tax=Leuconostoc gasicomitatum TaxID=115778 RepID=UPI001CC67AB8